MYQDIKDHDDIQYLLNLGREEGQIIAKRKMMRTKELEAAKKKRSSHPSRSPRTKGKKGLIKANVDHVVSMLTRAQLGLFRRRRPLTRSTGMSHMTTTLGKKIPSRNG